MQATAKLSELTKRVFSPREKFLVLEVTPSGTNAAFLGVDEDHRLIIERTVRGGNLKKFLRTGTLPLFHAPSLPALVARRKIIISADSKLATAMPVPLDLSRDRARWDEELSIDELENLIAQAMAKIFNQCRGEAAKRLGIDDIHTILVAAKAERFKIDGHAVMNPIGFTGRKISLLLELTFTTRELFEELKPFFNAPEAFFFIESPEAWMRSIARVKRLPLNLIVSDETGPSSLFVFQMPRDAHPVLYREKLNWSFRKIFEAIEDAFAVEEATARALYRDFHGGKFSKAAARHFSKVIQAPAEDLLRELERLKISGFVHLDAGYPAPFELPHKHAGATFEALPLEAIMTELGLAADTNIPFQNLAPFLEAYFAKTPSEINQKLRRRLHWLVE